MHKGDVDNCLIYKVIHGSHAYGFSTEDSDTDIRGICIPPKEYFLSMDRRFDQFEGEGDIVIYNIQKFFKLAVECNPNVIELIYIDDPSLVLLETEWSKRIKENRNLFLSTRVKFTFSGYAYSQLHRIKTHKKWLLDPPTHAPTRQEFNLAENNPMTNSELGALNKMIKNEEKLDGTAMNIVRRENAYQNAKQHWKQYQNWIATRNPARAELEKKYVYDTKHGCHLVRLLRMGEEILTQGKVIVQRPDAEELLDIRRGAWSYEKIVSYAEEIDKKLQEIYDSGKSPLPKFADRNKLNEVLMGIIEEYWKGGKKCRT